MDRFSRFSYQQILLAAVMVIALLARFSYLTEIEHNVDHAYPVWQALRTLDAGKFPITGQPTSVLFDNPALTGYLFIPAVALTHSPLGVYVFVIALNTTAVLLAFRAIRGLLGYWTALLAALLMAVNPWVIEYSRTSWVQSLLPFFCCLVAWLLWPVLMNRARHPTRRLVAALIATALLTQTYLLAFFMLAPVAALMLLFYRRLPLRGVLASAVFVLFSSAVFALGLLTQGDTLDARVDKFTAGESVLSMEALDHALRLVTGEGYAAARGLQAPIDDAQIRYDVSHIAHIALTITVGIGIAASIYAIYKRTTQRDTGIVLLVWFFLPIIAMSYTGNAVHPFYQLLTLPAGFGLAAWGLTITFQPQKYLAGKIMLLLLALPFITLMLLNSARYYQETAVIPGAHDLSALPVDVGIELGQHIKENLPPGGTVYADVDEWTLNSFAGELFPVVRDLRLPELQYIPTHGGLIVRIADAPAPLPPIGDRVQTLTLADARTITIDRIPPADQINLPTATLEIPSAQGMVLESFVLEKTEVGWTLMTVWRIDFIEAEVYDRIFGPFAHIYDANGERVAVVDGAGLAGTMWRVGDRQIQRMAFSLPPDATGPFSLRIGQYDGLHNANVLWQPTGAEPTVFIDLPQTIP